jgi:hypothetical protein
VAHRDLDRRRQRGEHDQDVEAVAAGDVHEAPHEPNVLDARTDCLLLEYEARIVTRHDPEIAPGDDSRAPARS